MSNHELVEYGGVCYARYERGGYYMLHPIEDGKEKHDVSLMEHRVVYETAYNVELPNSVHIHHMNRNTKDNRIENLIALDIRDHHKLHRFEDRNVDMRTARELEEKFRQYNSLKRSAVIRPAINSFASALVAYDNKIYHRLKRNGYVILRPLKDGVVDYDTEIPEHRLVYELYNGVKLPKGKCVYHKNGVRDDNRPENLTLVPTYCGSAVTPTRDELAELIKKKNNVEIAKEYGVSSSTVTQWRRRLGLPSANEQRGWPSDTRTIIEKDENKDQID